MLKRFPSLIGAVELRTPWFGIGRSILAFGQLSIFLFTPLTAINPPVLGESRAPHCSGIRAASAFCLGGGRIDPEILKWLPITILVAVIIGIFPRWIAIPHAWISFSIAQSIGLPDGGESVAQVLSLLIIPICLMDNRVWHWSSPIGLQGRRSKGVSGAALMFVRIQLAAIYIHGGISKLGTVAWLNGSAEYYISRSKLFGIDGPLKEPILWFTSTTVGAASLTWGTIILEISLGVLILGSHKMRLVALVGGVVLHVGIIATIGLWSFGLIMIGFLVIAALPEKNLREYALVTQMKIKSMARGGGGSHEAISV